MSQGNPRNVRSKPTNKPALSVNNKLRSSNLREITGNSRYSVQCVTKIDQKRLRISMGARTRTDCLWFIYLTFNLKYFGEKITQDLEQVQNTTFPLTLCCSNHHLNKSQRKCSSPYNKANATLHCLLCCIGVKFSKK